MLLLVWVILAHLLLVDVPQSSAWVHSPNVAATLVERRPLRWFVDIASVPVVDAPAFGPSPATSNVLSHDEKGKSVSGVAVYVRDGHDDYYRERSEITITVHESRSVADFSLVVLHPTLNFRYYTYDDY